MIDRAEISELLYQARLLELGPGDCLEVHVGPDWGPAFAEHYGPEDITDVRSFARQWDHVLELDRGPTADRAWLGIVHEDGAMLVAVPGGRAVNMTDRQLLLDFGRPRETRKERLRRILAIVPGVHLASDKHVWFDERGQREAEDRAIKDDHG